MDGSGVSVMLEEEDDDYMEEKILELGKGFQRLWAEG